MGALIMCVCGHAAKHHALDDRSWKTALCLTQFYVEPSDCRCDEYRPVGELVHVYWGYGGWHATLDADHHSGHVDGAQELAYRVTLGRRFIEDYESRDLPCGIVVSQNQRTYTLLMTVGDIREVYSDADHYSSGAMDDWLEDDVTGDARSVIQAAGRVVEALRKQVPDVLV